VPSTYVVDDGAVCWNADEVSSQKLNGNGCRVTW
jgi:hypothetical protein